MLKYLKMLINCNFGAYLSWTTYSPPQDSFNNEEQDLSVCQAHILEVPKFKSFRRIQQSSPSGKRFPNETQTFTSMSSVNCRSAYENCWKSCVLGFPSQHYSIFNPTMGNMRINF